MVEGTYSVDTFKCKPLNVNVGEGGIVYARTTPDKKCPGKVSYLTGKVSYLKGMQAQPQRQLKNDVDFHQMGVTEDLIIE